MTDFDKTISDKALKRPDLFTEEFLSWLQRKTVYEIKRFATGGASNPLAVLYDKLAQIGTFLYVETTGMWQLRAPGTSTANIDLDGLYYADPSAGSHSSGSGDSTDIPRINVVGINSVDDEGSSASIAASTATQVLNENLKKVFAVIVLAGDGHTDVEMGYQLERNGGAVSPTLIATADTPAVISLNCDQQLELYATNMDGGGAHASSSWSINGIEFKVPEVTPKHWVQVNKTTDSDPDTGGEYIPLWKIHGDE